jgi:hypothetical protein
MWYDVIPINGGPSYTWKNASGGENSMTRNNCEGRRTGGRALPSLNTAHQYVSGAVLENYTPRVSKIVLENKYALDWPQKEKTYHIHLTTPLARDTRARESESSHPASSARSEYQKQKQKNQKYCSFQQLQPQSTALNEEDTQARCEDPTSTKNMPISGKSAIVRAYN